MDTDSDSDGGACPADMHAMPLMSVCIDRYEASRGDGDAAESKAGARPWVNVDWEEAAAACGAAGKAICQTTAWSFACRGGYGKMWTYPYGNDYDEHACNGGDHGLGAAPPTSGSGAVEAYDRPALRLAPRLRHSHSPCSGITCLTFNAARTEVR